MSFKIKNCLVVIPYNSRYYDSISLRKNQAVSKQTFGFPGSLQPTRKMWFFWYSAVLNFCCGSCRFSWSFTESHLLNTETWRCLWEALFFMPWEMQEILHLWWFPSYVIILSGCIWQNAAPGRYGARGCCSWQHWVLTLAFWSGLSAGEVLRDFLWGSVFIPFRYCLIWSMYIAEMQIGSILF